MVGQRIGIRPARLMRWLGLLACLIVAIALVARKLSSDWLGYPSVAVQAKDSSEPKIPNDTPSIPSPSASPENTHPLDAVLSLAKDAMETHKRSHHSYRATVRKRERIGKELGPVSKMELKLRYRDVDPQSDLRRVDVYLKFLEPKSQAGREVIWREGINDSLMVVHESGLLNITRLELAPTSRLAMLGNRYPISDIGIERLLMKLLARGSRDRGLGECTVEVTEPVDVAGRECKRIEVCHPTQTVTLDEKSIEHEFYKAIIDIDSQLGIPIRYASYLWPETQDAEPILDEEFVYEQLELNPSLSDLDFDPDNPAYNYP